MDLAQMIVQFSTTTSVVLWRLLFIVAGLVGTVYVGGALLRLQRASRFPGSNPVTVGDILPVILVGAVLANLSVVINRAWNSFGTGTVTYGPIAYSGAAEFGRFEDAINAVFTLASVAGGFFFFKGVLLLKQATRDGQSSNGADDVVFRAITHMLGGVGLVQISEITEVFRQSFGLSW